MSKSPIFILGCERSGSTWIANILDAHPQTLMFMEPFAPFASIFPGFPERNVYMDGASPELVDVLQGRYSLLYRYKYALVYRPGRPLRVQSLDQAIEMAHRGLARLAYMRPSLRLVRYGLLNLNTQEIPVSERFEKAAQAEVEIVKELRLNFKVGALAEAFPDARYMVAIRHPGAQIGSIKRLFEQGSLHQLGESLLSFVETIGQTRRFEAYEDWIGALDWRDDLDSRLIIWWVLNYQTVIDDLERWQKPYKLIFHEDISEKPAQVAAEMLAFCGLEESEQLSLYLTRSSTREAGMEKGSVATVNTNRQSAVYYKQRLNETPAALRDKIQRAFASLRDSGLLADVLRRYVDE